jgi:hypothetical protein
MSDALDIAQRAIDQTEALKKTIAKTSAQRASDGDVDELTTAAERALRELEAERVLVSGWRQIFDRVISNLDRALAPARARLAQQTVMALATVTRKLWYKERHEISARRMVRYASEADAAHATAEDVGAA